MTRQRGWNRAWLAWGVACALVLVGLGVGAGAEEASRAAPPEVRVFAAASLADVLKELATLHGQRTGVGVKQNLASSSTLAKQLEQGAPADVFVSADVEWMDYAQERKLIRTETRRDLLGNALVLIAPKDKPVAVAMTNTFDLAGAFEGRLALGDPAHVPAGKYARAALEHFGWWARLRERILPCANVRDALTVVERGEVALGVVYATDAKASDKVVVAGTFPVASHPPILYPVSLCKGAGPSAEAFLAFLCGPEASAVFARHGFVPLAGKAAAPPPAR